MKSICSISFTNFETDNDNTYNAWESVLRSALLSLLNMIDGYFYYIFFITIKSLGEVKVDKTTIMLASTVMITSGPPTLTHGKTLFSKLCNLYKNCLDSSEPIEIQLKALQSVTSLFMRREIRGLFIQELGSTVFSKIRPYVVQSLHQQEINDETNTEEIMDKNIKEKSRVKSEFELPVLKEISNKNLLLIQETFKTMETILRYSSGEKGN